MQFGWVLPYGDARTAAELAATAEASGWDGFFVWEPVWGIDPWIALAAAAMRTERIRLGTMVTPLPRRAPWEVASQVATLDNLSGGRVILSVGLGAPDDRWWLFEDDPGLRVRAELLDEGLDLMTGLWLPEPRAYAGAHYRARAPEALVPPPPLQRPRVPIWVIGAWPRPRSMRRAARWDGWIPVHLPRDAGGYRPVTPALLAEGIADVRARRAREGRDAAPYDVIAEGTTPTDPAAAGEIVTSWAEAGATWWLEVDWSQLNAEHLRNVAAPRLAAGPPVLA